MSFVNENKIINIYVHIPVPSIPVTITTMKLIMVEFFWCELLNQRIRTFQRVGLQSVSECSHIYHGNEIRNIKLTSGGQLLSIKEC
jgi:hypothetical protein